MTSLSEIDLSGGVHAAVIDALLRFGAGTDDGDVVALRSTFAQDAVVDFRACGTNIGLDFELLNGADAIVDFLAGTSRRQATSHVVTNPRVSSSERRAHIRALVDATHVVRDDTARRFRLMNWYDADLVLFHGQ